jgi:hypothetical protein
MSFPFQMQEEPEPPKIKRSLSGGTHRSCSDIEDNALSILRNKILIIMHSDLSFDAKITI